MSHCGHLCPCGYYGDPSGRCTCSAATVTRYQHRISGPVLDRIDLHVDVPRVDYDKLAANRQRVERARERQAPRLAGTRLTCNADMGPAEVRKFCALDDTGRSAFAPWRDLAGGNTSCRHR